MHLPEMSIFPDLCQVRAHTAPYFLLSLFFLKNVYTCILCQERPGVPVFPLEYSQKFPEKPRSKNLTGLYMPCMIT